MDHSGELLNFDTRSERIALAQARLKAAYQRESGAEVPVVEPWVCPLSMTTRETLEDMDKMLVQAARWANSLAATDNDWPPVILGYCSVVMVPEAFGSEVVFKPGQSPWARHAISDISQVYHLKPRPPHETPTIRRHLEWIDYAQRKLGTDIPMWSLDIQSPFSVAAQIVDPEELMIACITNPKAVHHVVRMAMEYWIDLTRLLRSKMEHIGYPGANFPTISDDIGVVMADDTPLIMLGQEMYRELALPYNNQIGREFGGIHLHCCGDYRHNLDNVLAMTNIKSVQIHAGPGEFPLPETAGESCSFNRAREKIAYFMDTNDVARGDLYRNNYHGHYAEYVLPRLTKGDMTGCILQSCGFRQEADLNDVNDALCWTRQALAAAMQQKGK